MRRMLGQFAFHLGVLLPTGGQSRRIPTPSDDEMKLHFRRNNALVECAPNERTAERAPSERTGGKEAVR